MSENTALGVRMDHAEVRLDKHEDVHQRLFEGLDKVGKRPPVWVMPIVGILTAAIGWLLHMATI